MGKQANIIVTTIFFILVLFSFAFSQETLTITTYYPSPYGSYNELQLYPHPTPVTTCDDTNKGYMYYNSGDDTVYVCKGDTLLWQSLGGGGGGCPADFTDTGYGYCIQTAENSARTWYAASDYCADTYNARLCTSSEWYNACANSKADNMTGNYEWVDSWASPYTYAMVRGVSSCTDSYPYTALTDTYPFRCCRGK